MNENKAISEKELLDAMKNLLKKSGDLNKFQAEVRSTIIQVLQENLNGSKNFPKPPAEVDLINELIKEYLQWNGYLYTASVMTLEASLPDANKSRAELCAEVGVKDDEKSSALPLLSNIIAAYTERIKRKISKVKNDTK
ncbi:centrosomal protein 20 [Aricia agestis]|uniref:centrosomal protein 20 n=1 Tax=Aricia agestis TaxID=91739 RepID=UPI001C207CA9|nr:centrosomal protein 20 [Aricia agestis]